MIFYVVVSTELINPAYLDKFQNSSLHNFLSLSTLSKVTYDILETAYAELKKKHRHDLHV